MRLCFDRRAQSNCQHLVDSSDHAAITLQEQIGLGANSIKNTHTHTCTLCGDWVAVKGIIVFSASLIMHTHAHTHKHTHTHAHTHINTHTHTRTHAHTQVYLAEWLGCQVAVKELTAIVGDIQDTKAWQDMQHEVHMLGTYNHPNIMRCVCVCVRVSTCALKCM